MLIYIRLHRALNSQATIQKILELTLCSEMFSSVDTLIFKQLTQHILLKSSTNFVFSTSFLRSSPKINTKTKISPRRNPFTHIHTPNARWLRLNLCNKIPAIKIKTNLAMSCGSASWLTQNIHKLFYKLICVGARCNKLQSSQPHRTQTFCPP